MLTPCPGDFAQHARRAGSGCSAAGPREAADGLDRPVRPDHRQIDLVHALIVVVAIVSVMPPRSKLLLRIVSSRASRVGSPGISPARRRPDGRPCSLRARRSPARLRHGRLQRRLIAGDQRQEASSGKGTTWVTTTPAPASPSSLASALEPTKEILTKIGLKLIWRASLMNSARACRRRPGSPLPDRPCGCSSRAPLHGDGIALVGAFGDQLHAALVQRLCTPARPARPKPSSW